jgi:adenosine deaminase
MESTNSSSSLTFYETLPKIDLHRHLEGSIRFETVRQLARALEMGLPATAQLRPLVEVHENQPYTFENFLSKFSILRLFYRSQEIIGRITHEAISDAVEDNIKYLELRFTPAH